MNFLFYLFPLLIHVLLMMYNDCFVLVFWDNAHLFLWNSMINQETNLKRKENITPKSTVHPLKKYTWIPHQ